MKTPYKVLATDSISQLIIPKAPRCDGDGDGDGDGGWRWRWGMEMAMGDGDGDGDGVGGWRWRWCWGWRWRWGMGIGEVMSMRRYLRLIWNSILLFSSAFVIWRLCHSGDGVVMRITVMVEIVMEMVMVMVMAMVSLIESRSCRVWIAGVRLR